MRIRTSNICIENQRAWIVPGNISGIVEIDLHTGRSTMVAAFNGHGMFESLTCGTIRKNGDCLAVAPLRGEDLYLFYLSTGKVERHSLGSYLKGANIGRGAAKFYDSFSRGKNIYFIGCGWPAVIKIDVETQFVKVIEMNIKRQAAYYEDILGHAAGIFGKKVFIPLCFDNSFVIFDLAEDTYEIQKLGSYCCIGACCGHNTMCLLPIQGEQIEIYDIQEKKISGQVGFPDEHSGEGAERWYCTVLYHCGYAWIFPYQSNMILRLNLLTREAVCVKRFDSISDIKYINAGVYDSDRIWGLYHAENRLDIIDCRTFQIESTYFLAPDNLGDYIGKENNLQARVAEAIPEEYFSIDKYISYICGQKYKTSESQEMPCNGLKIWENVKNG